MQNLKILNSREIKELMKKINNQWGFSEKLDYVFLKNNKNKVFIVNKDISKIDFEKLRINSIGLYFCEVSDKIRLSIEGSQIIGPKSSKNICEIDDEQAKKWIKGENIVVNPPKENSGFQIIKKGKDFLGTGMLKNNEILNFVPKARRVNIKE